MQQSGNEDPHHALDVFDDRQPVKPGSSPELMQRGDAVHHFPEHLGSHFDGAIVDGRGLWPATLRPGRGQCISVFNALPNSMEEFSMADAGRGSMNIKR